MLPDKKSNLVQDIEDPNIYKVYFYKIGQKIINSTPGLDKK